MTATIYSAIKETSRREEFTETEVSYRTLGTRLPAISTQIETPTAKANRPQTAGITERPLRKLFGFLIEENGADARVGLIENGQVFLYDLPYEPLRENGIVLENQHFEMNELEMRFPDGRVVVGYSYRPLAGEKDAFVDHELMTEDRKQKLARIAKKFGKKAKD